MGPKRRLLYDEEAMEAACNYVREGRSKNRRARIAKEAATLFGVPYSSLKHRLLGRASLREQKSSVLPTEIEHRMVEWLKESAQLGSSKTRNDLFDAVQGLLNENNVKTSFKDNRPGRRWFKSFMTRYRDELSLEKLQAPGIKTAPVIKKEVAVRNCGPRLLYEEEAMEAAFSSVHQGYIKNAEKAAQLYGVPVSTLKHRLKGRASLRKMKRTILPIEIEHRVVEWLKELARRGSSKTMNNLLDAVQGFLNDNNEKTSFKDNRPGRKWFERFMTRHREELSVVKLQALEAQSDAVVKETLQDWFEEAYKSIIEVDPYVLHDPDRLFNFDETDFQLTGGIGKIRGPKKDVDVDQVTNDAHRQVAVLACGNAAGQVLPPLIVFPGQRFNYDPLAGFPEAHFSHSKDGRLDSEIFHSWLETAFIPEVSHLKRPVLLFVDGRKTYLSPQVNELCREHSIILYRLPNHVIQPLDLTTFKNLKRAWKEEVMNHQEEMCDTLSKRDFAKVLKKAWQRGVEKDAVIDGFKEEGIYPWDPHSVDVTKIRPSRLFTSITDTMTIMTPETNLSATAVTADPMTSIPKTMLESDILVMNEIDSASLMPVLTDKAKTSSGMTMTTNIGTSENGMARQTEMSKAVIPTDLTQPMDITDSVTDDYNTDSNVVLPLTSNIFPSSCHNLCALPDLPASPPAIQDCAQIQSTTACSSEHSETYSMSLSDGLDRLLDIVSICGHEKLVRYRATCDIRRPTSDPLEEIFYLLYNKLKAELQSKDHDNLSRDNIEGYE